MKRYLIVLGLIFTFGNPLLAQEKDHHFKHHKNLFNPKYHCDKKDCKCEDDCKCKDKHDEKTCNECKHIEKN
jgi:hypothetical protein